MSKGSEVLIPPGMLERIIQDKYQKIAYYNQLYKMAADHQDIELINGILLDESNHLKKFTDLFTDFYGEKPLTIEPEISRISSFIDGVKYSIRIELDSYELYSNVFFSDTNSSVREVFARALTDENRHTAKFNFIYTKLIERKQ